MRILLIGDACHQHMQNFAKWMMKSDPSNVIDILNTSFRRSIPVENPFNLVYNAYPKMPKIFRHGMRFYGNFLYKRCFQSIDCHYDFINIHFVSPNNTRVLNYLKEKADHLILTFWGSDFYRSSTKDKRVLTPLLKFADAIIADNPDLVNEIIAYYNDFSEKSYFCYYGCAPIDHLKVLKETHISPKQSKALLELQQDKVTIMLGHTGSPFHQHLKIIDILNHSSLLRLKDSIQFILPVTYGGSVDYIKTLREATSNSPFAFKFFETFMSDQDTAHLRNATDIMINLQKTDALSGTMKEVFYAGNVVINGQWLPYGLLKENHLYYHEIADLNALPEKLQYCIKHLDIEKEKSKVNEPWAYQSASWEINIVKWYSIFLKINEKAN